MKKTLIALMALTGVAMGSTSDYSVTLDSTFYRNPADTGGAWVHLWTGNGSDDNVKTAANWDVFKATTSTVADASSNSPSDSDPLFIGYTFSYVNGAQIMTANNEAIEVIFNKNVYNTNQFDWSNPRIYLGKNVTFTFDSANNALKNRTVGFNFGNFDGTSLIAINCDDSSKPHFWFESSATMRFSGSIEMSKADYSYTLVSIDKLSQNAGTWDASGVTVKDAYGNALKYTTDAEKIGQAGYYGVKVEINETTNAATVKLIAKAIPEPTTATLSLLALAGLAARRRRK